MQWFVDRNEKTTTTTTMKDDSLIKDKIVISNLLTFFCNGNN